MEISKSFNKIIIWTEKNRQRNTESQQTGENPYRTEANGIHVTIKKEMHRIVQHKMPTNIVTRLT